MLLVGEVFGQAKSRGRGRRIKTDLDDEVEPVAHATHHCGHDEPVSPISLWQSN